MSADLQSYPLKCIILTSQKKKVLSGEMHFFPVSFELAGIICKSSAGHREI